MTLAQLRKTLRTIIRHERADEWDAARKLYTEVFLPGMDMAASSMQLTADEVRRLL